MNKLFLQSLLQDSRLDATFVQEIQTRFGINPADFATQLAEADVLVFYENNTRSGNTSVTSVLKHIAIKSGENLTHYPHHVLTISKTVFPTSTIVQDYTLLDRYQAAVELIFTEGVSVENFADKLFHLQQFYLSSMASNGQPFTVSQFEYLKSRAAYAQCLATSTNVEQPFRLACGDLSGIQSFIFDIHSSKAYKSLKGRSFYLQLVVETLIARLLQDTSMTSANVVYSSGGKFYLLLPNTEGVENVIKDIDRKVQATLFKDFQLGLYVCLESIGFGFDKDGNIATNDKQADGRAIAGMGDLWKAVSEKAALKKANKYKSLLVSEFSTLFEGNLKNEDWNGSDTEICAVLGVPVKRKDAYYLNKEERDEEPVYTHQKVGEQIELGKKLRSNTILLMGNKGSIEPLDLGFHFDLVNTVKQGQATLLNPQSEDVYLDFIKRYNSTRFLFYGGNEQVLNGKGELADLQEIAKPLDDKALNKIGVIKMDVDNLGGHFQHQKDEYGTLAAMSDLSARLDWFFSGYLNTLRNSDKFKDSVNIIYAGGDDLCAVGRWDAVLDFASQVREDFRQYIGNLDGHLTISAGYALFSPKFPIAKAIKEAGDNLDEAKKFKLVPLDKTKVIDKNAKADKNAIHLLGVSVNWQMERDNHREWQFVKDLQQLFERWLNEGTISKGTIYKLFVFKDNKDRCQLDWRWQSAYYFAKMKNPQLNVLRNAMITDKFEHPSVNGHFPERMFDLIILAAKLADYHSRKN